MADLSEPPGLPGPPRHGKGRSDGRGTYVFHTSGNYTTNSRKVLATHGGGDAADAAQGDVAGGGGADEVLATPDEVLATHGGGDAADAAQGDGGESGYDAAQAAQANHGGGGWGGWGGDAAHANHGGGGWCGDAAPRSPDIRLGVDEPRGNHGGGRGADAAQVVSNYR